MPDSFFDLSVSDKQDLLAKGSSDLGMRAFVLEKDVWVCWALERLFSMPGKLNMAFKGGTSLSKVYKLIDRFSEDIDVSIDYRESTAPLRGDESRSKLKKLSEELRDKVREHTNKVVVPYFQKALRDAFGSTYGKVEVGASGEDVRVFYESVVDQQSSDYVASAVLLEFGGRNIVEPNAEHIVSPYLLPVSADVTYPEAKVTVLAMERTYWEKITLVHVECRKGSATAGAERIFRHWYDLFKMSADLDRYSTAEMYSLLTSVVHHKKAFYNSSAAGYDDCLIGKLQLVPDADLRTTLEADFAKMQDAGMFYDRPPAYDEILARLEEVEQYLNDFIRKHRS